MSRSTLKLKEQHTPRKELGQNFLADKNILRKLVDAAQVGASDTVLEIGAGLGHLTRVLAETGTHIVSVELDRQLFKNLQVEFAQTPNVMVLEGDVLQNPPREWLAQAQLAPPYRVVANIPYYITSPILRYLLEAAPPPSRIVLMTQREVAQQIIAKPPHATLLGVSVQFYGAPRIVANVPAGAFYPRPKVDSAIVRIDVTDPAPTVDTRHFFRVVRAGFGAKRKQLHNALAGGLQISTAEVGRALLRAKIDPSRRAETLTIAEWETLAQGIAAAPTPLPEPFQGTST